MVDFDGKPFQVMSTLLSAHPVFPKFPTLIHTNKCFYVMEMMMEMSVLRLTSSHSQIHFLIGGKKKTYTVFSLKLKRSYYIFLKSPQPPT